MGRPHEYFTYTGFGGIVSTDSQMKVISEKDLDRAYSPNIAIMFGILSRIRGPYGNEDFNEWGPTFNVSYIWPRIDFQFGPYVRYITYSQDDKTDTRWPFGIIGRFGFSMLTTYVGVGKDFAYDENTNLLPGVMFSAGISLTVPTSRISR